MEVKESDCYDTPKWATKAIVKYLPKGCKIWEPFAGNRCMSKVLIKNGFKVRESEIQWDEKMDFFHYQPKKDFDVIVSNPPYSVLNKVMQRIHENEWKYFLLVPVYVLGSQGRYDIFKDEGVNIYLFREKVNFLKGGAETNGAPFFTVWASNVPYDNELDRIIYLD